MIGTLMNEDNSSQFSSIFSFADTTTNFVKLGILVQLIKKKHKVLLAGRLVSWLVGFKHLLDGLMSKSVFFFSFFFFCKHLDSVKKLFQ